MSDEKNFPARRSLGSTSTVGAGTRRSKFGTASEGWDAYNNWLDRVRQQPGPTSRQAVISKALYSVSSYKNWVDKARDAFDEES